MTSDTLVTVFMGHEIIQSVITLADLHRMHPQIQQASGVATIEDPVRVVICWKPLNT